MAALYLTVNEAAEISGVPALHVEKAIEEGVVTRKVIKDKLCLMRVAHVPIQIVAYVSVLKHVQSSRWDLNTKKRLFRCIRNFGDELGTFEIIPGVCLSIDILASAEWLRARSYIAAKSAHLDSRKDILGGEPVIIGTCITCRSLLGRIDGGDTLDDLCQDYRNIPSAAFEAAIIYARTHPPGGRPAEGRPWRR